jgi:hypothetical protein
MASVKTKLKLFEIIAITEEIHGLQDRSTGEKIQKGLLDEKISLVQKYWLTDLGKTTKGISDEIEPLRNELITKYGDTAPDGSIGVSAFLEVKNEQGEVVNKVPNPKWSDFDKEYTELLDQEKEIEHQEFILEDFADVKSENRYGNFQKILKPKA